MLVNVSINDIKDPAVRRCLSEMQRQMNFCIEELTNKNTLANNIRMRDENNE